jgi:hypothetical protein
MACRKRTTFPARRSAPPEEGPILPGQAHSAVISGSGGNRPGLAAIQRHHVHQSPSAQVTVSGRPHQSPGIHAGLCTFVLCAPRGAGAASGRPCLSSRRYPTRCYPSNNRPARLASTCDTRVDERAVRSAPPMRRVTMHVDPTPGGCSSGAPSPRWTAIHRTARGARKPQTGLASVGCSTNIAWSHDADEVFGTHRSMPG